MKIIKRLPELQPELVTVSDASRMSRDGFLSFCSKVELSFIQASAIHGPWHHFSTTNGCRSNLQHFTVTCVLQVFISHPPTSSHPLDLWGPLFHTGLLAPTYQSHDSAVITCVCLYLLSPHPVSKSRIRVQSGWETRSPSLLFPLLPCPRLSPWLQGLDLAAMGTGRMFMTQNIEFYVRSRSYFVFMWVHPW